MYRLVGALAAVALVAYGLVSYAALLAVGATLTLPGLAGFVLAIGMAVDANVLVFERAREEYAAKPSLRTAIRDGFGRAWSAIADSNVTTLVAAALLFLLASGPGPRLRHHPGHRRAGLHVHRTGAHPAAGRSTAAATVAGRPAPLERPGPSGLGAADPRRPVTRI